MSNLSSAYDKLFMSRKKPDLIHEYIQVLVAEKQKLVGLLEVFFGILCLKLKSFAQAI